MRASMVGGGSISSPLRTPSRSSGAQWLLVAVAPVGPKFRAAWSAASERSARASRRWPGVVATMRPRILMSAVSRRRRAAVSLMMVA